MVRRLCLISTFALCASSVGAAGAAAADELLYRCYPNLCKIGPDGKGKRQLTRDGRRQGPVYAWVSASHNGKRLGISFGNDAYVADGAGRRRGDKYRDTGGAVPVVQISPDGRTLATIEPTVQLSPPPPGEITPPLASLNPFLFTADVASRDKETVARSIVTTGWLSNRLMRDDTSDTPPFEQRICLLRTNTDFDCERVIAAEPRREIWNPAASPGGRLIAAVSAPEDEVSGPIKLFDPATGRPVRTLTRKVSSTPSWSRDGKRVAFTSGGSIWVIPAKGGRARRVTKGVQPVWVPR